MSQAIVQSCTQFKTGVGKKGPWTLYKVVTTDNQEPTGFDYVQPGEYIEVTQTQNGQYTNLNYAKAAPGAAPAPAPAQPAPAPAAAPAPYQAPAAAPAAAPAPVAAAPVAGGNDPRLLRLLVIMAEAMGVQKEQIMEVLENR